jgi:hypothetical protein
LSWLALFFFLAYSWLSEYVLPELYQWFWLKDRLEKWKKESVSGSFSLKMKLDLLPVFWLMVFPKKVQKELSYKLKQ